MIELDRAVLREFATEMLEHVAACEQVLVRSSTEPLYEQDFHLLLRSVHSIKGLARVLTSAGRYDEAAGECLKLPENGLGRTVCLGRARLGQGRISEAIQLLTSAVDRGVPNLGDYVENVTIRSANGIEQKLFSR